MRFDYYICFLFAQPKKKKKFYTYLNCNIELILSLIYFCKKYTNCLENIKFDMPTCWRRNGTFAIHNRLKIHFVNISLCKSISTHDSTDSVFS